MPRAGGLSDKVGNRFEDRWTVRCVFDVLEEYATAIRLEPPGEAGDGVEFWIHYEDRTVYHQCKRQRTGQGHWTLAALNSAGVLQAFLGKLADPAVHCEFASTHAADQLEELATRARNASSALEFDTHFLDSVDSRSWFNNLTAAWGGIGLDDAFSALRRIHVTTISEEELCNTNKIQAELILDGGRESAVPVLTELLRARAGDYLKPVDIWRGLKEKNYGPSPWRTSAALSVSVADANRRFVASRERTLISGTLIERPSEADALRALIESQRVVLVHGEAGTGKSDVLLQLVNRMESEGLAHLAFRLDRIEPTLLPEEIGRQLGLPASPVTTLAAYSQGEIGVLVIDQLDAVSVTSGRAPQLYECVNEIITTALTVPSLRIVLSCRSFDLENDSRLRRLTMTHPDRSTQKVGPFDDDQIADAVTSFGLDPAKLTGRQVELLRLPLHLALLEGTATASAQETGELRFNSSVDLLTAFWTEKRREAGERLNHPLRWTQVLDALIDHMSQNQSLWAPADLTDEWESDLAAMVSCNVIVRDRDRLAFFHEVFFDYVFARRHAAQGRSVTELLRVDQDLFRRTQVRQLLAYNRGRDERDRYLPDLTYLLNDTAVRFHLRSAVLSWLGRVSPTADEWVLLKAHLEDDQSDLHRAAWRIVATRQWFAIADRHGYIDSCLDSGVEQRVDLALSTLPSEDESTLSRSLQLIQTYADDSPAWRRRVMGFLHRVDIASSRPAFDVLTQLVASDLGLDCVEPREVWSFAQDMAATQPAWTNELVGLYLENRMAVATLAGFASPFDRSAETLSTLAPSGMSLGDFLNHAATAEPQSFLSKVWPRVHAIIAATLRDRDERGLLSDGLWPIRHLRGGARTMPDDLLTSSESAIAELAREFPQAFESFLDDHRDTRSESVVSAIFTGFAANPSVFADVAVGELIDHPQWLIVGWSHANAWGTRRLIEAISSDASNEAIAHLSELLLSFYPEWERTVAGRYAYGSTQFTLLSGIAVDRRSDAVHRRIMEWQRKFGCDDIPAPEGIRGGVVQSPIAASSAAHMTNSQWLTAVARYTASESRTFRDGLLVGGVAQLANVLQAEANSDPSRFAEFASLLPDSADPRYFEAILRGVAESDAVLPVEEVEALLSRCHRLPSRPCGLYITAPLRHIAGHPLSGEMVAIVDWYATENRDESTSSMFPDVDDLDERLLLRGLNSVQGAVASVVAYLVATDHLNVSALDFAISALLSDRDPGVRAAAAQVVLTAGHHDVNESDGLFDVLTSDAPDELLANRYIYEYLRQRVNADFGRFRPMIERMTASAIGDVQMRGAALASLAALANDEALDLASEVLRGTEKQRVGAARVYAANIKTARFNARCATSLATLFEDHSLLVRNTAAEVVRELYEIDIDEYVEVINPLISSPAADGNWGEILDMFKRSPGSATGLALAACRRVLSQQSADAPLEYAHRPDLISTLLVRVYTDNVGEIRSSALDLIDQLLRQEDRVALRAIAVHDRDWGDVV